MKENTSQPEEDEKIELDFQNFNNLLNGGGGSNCENEKV